MKKLNKKNVKEMNLYLIDPILEAAAQERPHREIESDAHYISRLRKQINQSFNDFNKRFEKGIAILDKRDKWPHDERMKKVSILLSDHTKWDEVSQLKTLQEIAEITNDELASFYREGWVCYHEEAFEEASYIFLVLTQLNPKVGSFWSALGAAEEKCGEFQDAMNAYLLGAELETHTLAPYLHGAKCLLMLDKIDRAKFVLKRAIERALEEEALKKDLPYAQEMLKSLND